MKLLISLILFPIALACAENPKENISIVSHKNDPEYQIDSTESANFDQVKNYIQNVGVKEIINASSSVEKEMLVTYHSIELNEFSIIVDHSNRIYISKNGVSFGNVLKENDKIFPEVVYGVPDKNPAETKEKEQKVMEIYSELVKLALEWKK